MDNKKTTQLYLFSYYHENSWWSFEIPAFSKEDAIARIKKMPHAKFDGEVKFKIPATSSFLRRFLSHFLQ